MRIRPGPMTIDKADQDREPQYNISKLLQSNYPIVIFINLDISSENVGGKNVSHWIL
jgi:hypothetical protein